MKSVDALRKWADGLSGIWIDQNDHSIIVTTCDDMPPSIDCVNLREHVNGILDGIEREVKDMVTLPVDADGVPIHVGDVLDSKVDYLFDGKPFTVRALVLCEDGWEVGDGRFGNRYEPDSLHHHHAPTVEDVLREFAYGLGVPVADSYVAAAAAKLRLAGEDA